MDADSARQASLAPHQRQGLPRTPTAPWSAPADSQRPLQRRPAMGWLRCAVDPAAVPRHGHHGALSRARTLAGEGAWVPGLTMVRLALTRASHSPVRTARSGAGPRTLSEASVVPRWLSKVSGCLRSTCVVCPGAVPAPGGTVVRPCLRGAAVGRRAHVDKGTGPRGRTHLGWVRWGHARDRQGLWDCSPGSEVSWP